VPPRINDDERLRRLEAITDAALSRLDVSDLLDELLELVADRAAVAVRIRSAKLDAAAALALQRSLLPDLLPAVPGVDLAARYVPGHATGVGGDWYDVFLLPSGWLGVVIGDVSGHGLGSAVVMGRIRSALRAYALICDDPAQALTLLDRKVQHFEAGSLTTALYAMISPGRDRAVLSSAGHLRPVLVGPDSPAGLAVLPVDPPLGVVRPGRPRRSTEVPLAPGTLMLCYTDGLVERRGEVIDTGLDRLVATVRADPPEVVCATVMSDTADALPADDVAVLAVRRHG
jgi:phosphoserine phosphatase RsbU/P